MNRIRLLPEDVASQVAAGEVVERPASVVKELVENSLDSGAKRIEVRIRGGGSSSIRVSDDGSGMGRDDALLSLERHATSKIRTGADLAAIATLGFRGEALPSIASVSRFLMQTRPHDAPSGTEIRIAGGKIESVKDSGEAPGTQIEARSLFFNLPARRKFLRTAQTESSHVEHLMRVTALGHPGVAFVLVNDERLVWQLPPAPTLLDRIRDLWGGELASQLVEVPQPGENVPVKISGWLGKAGVSRSNRSMQHLFVNGRPVENLTVSAALREGYHTALMKGQYPVTFLFLEMDPAEVDVNVHPAKREVRFRRPSDVRLAVSEAVRAALESDRETWTAKLFSPPPLPATPLVLRPETRAPVEIQGELPVRERQTVVEGAARAVEPAARRDFVDPVDNVETALERPAVSVAPVTPAVPAPTKESGSPFRVIGVLGLLYILMENREGLVLVDQHAAHERVLFEEFRRRLESQEVLAQRLLLPTVLQLPPQDADWVDRHQALLEKLGLHLEAFGSGTYKLDSLPGLISAGDPAKFVMAVIEDLQGADQKTSRLRLAEDVIAATVCRHAVKAHDVLRPDEIDKLVRDLMACEIPYVCPHGRPTMIQIDYRELERKFGRVT